MGFFNPTDLLWLLSFGVLVAIYLRARSRPTIDVSSLMLFDEIPAPVAKSRVLRVDLLFWLELLALAALSLAIAGLYVRSTVLAGSHRHHALVFDLGAGMGAIEQSGGTRLDQARREALAIVADAPAGDQFSVISYALETQLRRAATADKDAVRTAIAALVPHAVGTRPAALTAALMRARGADTVDLFTGRTPPAGVIADAGLPMHVDVHGVGAPAANLAIVSLDPGTPKSTLGRCVVRNFSFRPQPFNLTIEAGGKPIFRHGLIIEPRAQMVLPFGPLPAGGLVHAQIVTPDALAADNDRYAYAENIVQAHALVLSPDAAARDDLARIVLAVNPDFLVTASDPSTFKSTQTFDLAIIHDAGGAGVNAKSKLFVFPEPRLKHSTAPRPLIPVTGTVALAELHERAGVGVLTNPVLLGPSRIVALPGWMDVIARGAAVGEQSSFALAGSGRNAQGEVGVIAFDVRDHLLLDPDRMDALLLTVSMIKGLIAPQDLKIVSTGDFVELPIFARARLIAPAGGGVTTLEPDQWGRVRFRPLEAGLYRVESNGHQVKVYANYYDASESDLAAAPATNPSTPTAKAAAPLRGELHAEPVAALLMALALLFLLAESALLARRASRWGMRHV
ncbi:MAG: BatA domain-containing protein [Candidatus Binataceae bacterium]